MRNRQHHPIGERPGSEAERGEEDGGRPERDPADFDVAEGHADPNEEKHEQHVLLGQKRENRFHGTPFVGPTLPLHTTSDVGP